MAGLYRPLDPSKRQIRTLVLYKGCGKERIKCSLQIVSLETDQTKGYETVSYCWGDASKRASIEVDGIQLDVPASSEAALRRLRMQDMSRTIWIDAICINQGDVVERGQQVSLMADIYRGSEGKLVCLGEDDRYLKKALKAVDMILKQARKETYNYQTLGSALHGQQPLQMCLASDEPLPRFDVPSLEWLYTLPWFRRLWIIQEVALAPRNLCHCGDRVFDLLGIVRAAVWVMLKRTSANLTINMDKFAPPIHLFNLVDKEHGAWRFPHARGYATFGDILLAFSMRYEVTDSRDAIYGLTGLAAKLLAAPALIMDMIRPNYNNSMWETLQNGTRYTLYHSAELSLLRTVKHMYDDKDFPGDRASWIVPAIRGSQDHLDSALSLKLLDEPFDCCSSRPLDLSLLADPLNGDLSILSLRGIVVDTIVDTTAEVFQREMFVPKGYLAFVRQLRSVLSLLRSEQDDEGISEDLYKVVMSLIAGSTKDSQSASFSFPHDLAQILSELLQMGDDADLRQVNSVYQRGAFQIAAVRRGSNSRKFFMTESGFMGVGPRGTKKGDIVTILYGGPEPFILRRSDSYHHFLGQAYVHGIMKGVDLEEQLRKSWTETVFHIR